MQNASLIWHLSYLSRFGAFSKRRHSVVAYLSLLLAYSNTAVQAETVALFQQSSSRQQRQE